MSRFFVAYLCSMEELNIFTITAAIADPVRLSVMMYLMRGEASVTEMINHLEVSQSNLSNHLAVLKNAGLIKATPAGRQKIYELANADVAQLIELLQNLQPTPKKIGEVKPIQLARTCYDHLAGKLGVGVFNALMAQGAIKFDADEIAKNKRLMAKAVIPGPNASPVFKKLGVTIPQAKDVSRKYAFGCMDWTEKTPHLAGALGAAVCKAFFDQQWVVRKNGSRTVTVTPSGRQALKKLINLDIE